MNRKSTRSEDRVSSKPYTRADKKQKLSSPISDHNTEKTSNISPQAITDRINNSDKYEDIHPGSLQDFITTPSDSPPQSPETMPPVPPEQKLIQDITNQLKNNGASVTYESVTQALDKSNIQNTDNIGLYESRAILWYSAGYNDAVRSSEIQDANFAKKQLPTVSSGLLSTANTLIDVVQKFDEISKRLNKKTSISDLNSDEIVTFCLTAYDGKSSKERASSLMMYLHNYIGYSNIYNDIANPNTVERTFNFMKTLDPIAVAVMTTLGETAGTPIVADRVAKDKHAYALYSGKRV
nr:phosphoprotein [Physostegia chlorotic mottle virus]